MSTQNVNVARFARNVECALLRRFSNTVIWVHFGNVAKRRFLSDFPSLQNMLEHPVRGPPLLNNGLPDRCLKMLAILFGTANSPIRGPFVIVGLTGRKKFTSLLPLLLLFCRPSSFLIQRRKWDQIFYAATSCSANAW